MCLKSEKYCSGHTGKNLSKRGRKPMATYRDFLHELGCFSVNSPNTPPHVLVARWAALFGAILAQKCTTTFLCPSVTGLAAMTLIYRDTSAPQCGYQSIETLYLPKLKDPQQSRGERRGSLKSGPACKWRTFLLERDLQLVSPLCWGRKLGFDCFKCITLSF